MGNIHAAGPGLVPPPTMPGTHGESSTKEDETGKNHVPQSMEPHEDAGPGYFEDLHKKSKGI